MSGSEQQQDEAMVHVDSPMGQSPAGGNGSGKIRRSGAERRAEIAAATLSLIARYGFEGASVNRIAEEVGIAGPSLYRHFSNRHEMLLAAIDLVFERVDRWLASSDDPDCLRRLVALCDNHTEYLAGQSEGFTIPMFEFIAAPRELRLVEALTRGQLEALKRVVAIIDGAKEQGTIRKDVDSRFVAWQFMVCAWGEDVAKLLEFDEFETGGLVPKMLRAFLRDIATSPDLVPRPKAGDR